MSDAKKLDSSLIAAVEQLVHEEVACLNRGDLDAWMTLFTDDGYYWMPLDAAQVSPHDHDSLIFDNRPLMEMRRNNLGHRLSPSMQRTVRSVRVLSALHCTESATKSDAIDVITSVIAAIYHQRQDTYAANVTYTVVGKDTPKIYCKRVDLINADSELDAIMMYV